MIGICINIIGILMCLAGVAFIIVMAESTREGKRYEVTEYEIVDTRLAGLKTKKTIVFISDLHSKIFDEGNKSLLESIRLVNPELILVGGDIMLGRALDSCFVGEALLLELAKDYPVFYANGNHEQRMKIGEPELQEQFQQYKENLEKAGVVFLENDNRTIQLDQQFITLWGLEIDNQYFKKCNYRSLPLEEMEDAIGRVDEKNQLYKDNYNVLLAHNPVHGGTYVKWGADLVLSGHLHGGMIRLPYIGGIITPQVRLFPKYSGGKYRENDTDIIVSRGLGGHTVKVRFMNYPEVVVLHLGKEKA